MTALADPSHLRRSPAALVALLVLVLVAVAMWAGPVAATTEGSTPAPMPLQSIPFEPDAPAALSTEAVAVRRDNARPRPVRLTALISLVVIVVLAWAAPRTRARPARATAWVPTFGGWTPTGMRAPPPLLV